MKVHDIDRYFPKPLTDEGYRKEDTAENHLQPELTFSAAFKIPGTKPRTARSVCINQKFRSTGFFFARAFKQI